MYTRVVVDYSNIYIVHYYCMLLMAGSKMLVEHMGTSVIEAWNMRLKDGSSNYSHRMVEEVESSNIEVEEERDRADNTWMHDETVGLDSLEWLFSYLINQNV